MYLLLALRLVHIVSGALWVGMMAYTVVFLTPALRDAGPDGEKVMSALLRGGVRTAMPLLALTTMASGMWLFHRLSGGAPMAFLRTPVGSAFGIGGAAALTAFMLGLVVLRPAMGRATALGATLGSVATEEERAARTAEIRRLRTRAAAAGRGVALLLILAAGAMAVARYV